MKLHHYILAGLFLLLHSCTESENKNRQPQVSGIEKINQLFSYTDHGPYKVIHVFSEKIPGDTLYTYVLYHKGSPRPSLNAEATYIATPVDSVACLSSLYIGCLEKLNLLDKVIAVDNKDYISNPYIRKRTKEGTILEIAKSEGIDVEQTLLRKPGLIITYGTGNPETDLNKKITAAGIPFAISLDHLESTPLARAGWLKFIAAFFEREKMADSLLAEINRQYEDLKTLAASAQTKPTVLTEIKLNDAWFVPGGKSFMARLLSDAGADYIWKKNDKPGSLALSYEEVYSKALDADYWINLSGWNSLDDCIAQDERNRNFKAYQNKNLYNNNARLNPECGNAYWETGLISPDEILRDLVKIFHPELLPGHQLKYYKRLE